MSNIFLDKLDSNVESENKAFITEEKVEVSDINADKKSAHFAELDDFQEGLFNPENYEDPIDLKISDFIDPSPTVIIGKEVISDKIILEKWKNVENVSARFIEFYDEIVVLECLIDKEEGIYEEREFKITLFEGYKLELGELYYLRFFERKNEMKIEIHAYQGLVLESDFPKLDFVKDFSNSKLFKKK